MSKASDQIDLVELRYAIHTADQGSISAAARRLNVKQTTLSRALTQLETRIGIRIFQRSTRGATPTDAGTSFLREISLLINDFDRVVASARQLNSGDVGRLSVGFCGSLSGGHLRRAIADFRSAFPNVAFHGVEDDKRHMLRRLRSGAIDIVIIVDDFTDPEFEKRLLWSERLKAVVPKTHKLAALSRVYWKDLRDLPFVLQSTCPGPEIASYLRSKLSEPGFDPEFFHQELGRENIINLVAMGGGATLIEEPAANVARQDVAFLDIREVNGHAHIEYSAYWRKDNNKRELANFLELIGPSHSINGAG